MRAPDRYYSRALVGPHRACLAPYGGRQWQWPYSRTVQDSGHRYRSAALRAFYRGDMGAAELRWRTGIVKHEVDARST